MISDVIMLKGVIFEDFVNYKKPSMTLMFPTCKGFKCGENLCQNSDLANAKNEVVFINNLLYRYASNPITEAIVLQGLEPFDSLGNLYTLAINLKELEIKDDIVIYTGYNKDEISTDVINYLIHLIPGRLIIKWGRYIPNQTPHLDPVLGVNLASDNQYAEVY